MGSLILVVLSDTAIFFNKKRLFANFVFCLKTNVLSLGDATFKKVMFYLNYDCAPMHMIIEHSRIIIYEGNLGSITVLSIPFIVIDIE